MGNYKLVLKRSVAKDLRSIPSKDVLRILEIIESLAYDPRPSGCQKLSNQERYRLRVGIYRVLYEIQDDILLVLIVKIAHRRDAYRPR